jgi:predicted DNA-binding WGR domain protein
MCEDVLGESDLVTTPLDDADEDESDDDEGGDDEGGGGFRRFEVDEKFWSIQLHASAHTVRLGKIGTDGQEKTKEFDDEDEAQKDYDRLIREKTKKGYEEV